MYVLNGWELATNDVWGQLPYQMVIQPVRMLSMLQLGAKPYFFSLLWEKRCRRAFFMTVLV
jgi:hypothetical protein